MTKQETIAIAEVVGENLRMMGAIAFMFLFFAAEVAPNLLTNGLLN